MPRNAAKLIPSSFPQLPGLEQLQALKIECGPLQNAAVAAYAVFADGDIPAQLQFTREQLEANGFKAEIGSALMLPNPGGQNLMAVGAGKAEELDGPGLRDIAAAAANAAVKFPSLGLSVDTEVEEAARFLVEGAALARYRYTALKTASEYVPLTHLELDVPQANDAHIAAAVARTAATVIARDVTNTPPGHLTATDLAGIAVTLAESRGFSVEVFGKDELIQLGCGGILGVNRGSFEPPQMIKLHYRPAAPRAHVGLVGKGITYDSGGLSLKPSDGMLLMKMDMGGAGAVLGAMSALAELGVDVEVTAWLMCTDNMIAGDAYRLGDVLTAADGTTVEVKNTDAEGRLVLMDGISLAAREDVDAIFDIATLTGAAMVALGASLAAAFTDDDHLAELVAEAGSVTGEETWRLPLEKKYNKLLESSVADVSNIGSTRYGGAITAALFLQRFAKDKPWVHIDIAGPMNVDSLESWRPTGATGYGARLLLETLRNY